MREVFFWFFGSLAVASALLVIFLRNPLSGAFFLILSFIHLAGLYVLLDAHLIAVAQVLVYAGAIMVFFIFVIMLLNVGQPVGTRFLGIRRSHAPSLIAVLLSLAALFVILLQSPPGLEGVGQLPVDFGTITAVGKVLFTEYLVPFELIGVLLLVATVGSVLLAKREI